MLVIIIGDVMYFEALGKPLIILSSAQAAKDLLDRRSSNYSTRPQMIMLKLCVTIQFSYPAPF